MSVKKLEKPDPGENYRLLEKSPVEALKPGDEAFDLRGDGKWEASCNVETGFGQAEGIWYRRKIEPVKPKYAVGQRVRVIGPKARPGPNWSSPLDALVGTVHTVRSEPLQFTTDKTFGYQVGVIELSIREDYLEPVVEPAQAEPNVLYPKIGDVIFLPELGRLRVTARGFEIC
jgi:hypothetical protein